ncbi:DUF2279 domain-containing protein [bacterium]|nr:DUF2279 domain-containing protein [bacterium]
MQAISADSLSLKQKRALVFGGNAVAYAGTMTGLYSLWYKNYDLGPFHFFNDNRDWLQMDKVGHAYSCYYEGVVGIKMMKYAGYSDKTAAFVGGSYGFLIQTTVEIFDGFSQEWGASTGDVIANFAGSSIAIGQHLAWHEQRIWMKYSYYPSPYAEIRPNALGSNFPESLLKDYNAQTYWLSTNIRSFIPDSKFPAWLNIAVGYGADGMLGGDDNIYTDSDGIVNDYSNIARTRQFYLSPDIDFTRIPTNSKALKIGFTLLNCLKFPLPALEYNTSGDLDFHWFH